MWNNSKHDRNENCRIMSTAFLTLVNDHIPFLKRQAYKFTRDWADADDLLQDTMAHLIQKHHKFQLNTDFKAWSRVVMKNLFLHAKRVQKRRFEIIEEKNALKVFQPYSTVDNEGEHQLNVEYLENEIENLGKNLSTPFKMYCYGYKYEEIASICEIPLGTVKTRIFSARKKLQSRLSIFSKN